MVPAGGGCPGIRGLPTTACAMSLPCARGKLVGALAETCTEVPAAMPAAPLSWTTRLPAAAPAWSPASATSTPTPRSEATTATADFCAFARLAGGLAAFSRFCRSHSAELTYGRPTQFISPMTLLSAASIAIRSACRPELRMSWRGRWVRCCRPGAVGGRQARRQQARRQHGGGEHGSKGGAAAGEGAPSDVRWQRCRRPPQHCVARQSPERSGSASVHPWRRMPAPPSVRPGRSVLARPRRWREVGRCGVGGGRAAGEHARE